MKGEVATVFATRGPRCAAVHRAERVPTRFGRVSATRVVTWSRGIMCRVRLLINKLNQACFSDHHHLYWGSFEPHLFILDSRGLTSCGTAVVRPPDACQGLYTLMASKTRDDEEGGVGRAVRPSNGYGGVARSPRRVTDTSRTCPRYVLPSLSSRRRVFAPFLVTDRFSLFRRTVQVRLGSFHFIRHLRTRRPQHNGR